MKLKSFHPMIFSLKVFRKRLKIFNIFIVIETSLKKILTFI